MYDEVFQDVNIYTMRLRITLLLVSAVAVSLGSAKEAVCRLQSWSPYSVEGEVHFKLHTQTSNPTRQVK